MNNILTEKDYQSELLGILHEVLGIFTDEIYTSLRQE